MIFFYFFFVHPLESKLLLHVWFSSLDFCNCTHKYTFNIVGLYRFSLQDLASPPPGEVVHHLLLYSFPAPRIFPCLDSFNLASKLLAGSTEENKNCRVWVGISLLPANKAIQWRGLFSPHLRPQVPSHLSLNVGALEESRVDIGSALRSLITVCLSFTVMGIRELIRQLSVQVYKKLSRASFDITHELRVSKVGS